MDRGINKQQNFSFAFDTCQNISKTKPKPSFINSLILFCFLSNYDMES